MYNYIIEMCPICGVPIQPSVICTIPPISVKECPACGWYKVEKAEIQYIKADEDI